MSQKLLKKKRPSEEEPQSHPVYVEEGVLKKITFIADTLRWSRSTLILESIRHVLNLLEPQNKNMVPDFVIMTRALQMANRFNFHLIKDPLDSSQKSKKIQTGVAIPPIFLRKIDFIVSSMGSSRNSFISLCLVHTINIVRDEQADPIPDIVKVARIYTEKSKQIRNFLIVEPSSPLIEKKQPQNIGYRRKKKNS